MEALPRDAATFCYSRPGALDRVVGEDFNAIGHLSQSHFEEAGVPREAEVYLCRPNRFMADMKMELASFGVAPERFTSKSSRGASP